MQLVYLGDLGEIYVTGTATRLLTTLYMSTTRSLCDDPLKSANQDFLAW